MSTTECTTVAELEAHMDEQLVIFGDLYNRHREEIRELKERNEKLLKWAKVVVERLDELENPTPKVTTSGPQKWTQAEEDYLWEEARLSQTLADTLHALANQWPTLFKKTRTYISLRKKFNRLKEAHK